VQSNNYATRSDSSELQVEQGILNNMGNGAYRRRQHYLRALWAGITYSLTCSAGAMTGAWATMAKLPGVHTHAARVI
jgi:hypothetical protein